MSSPPGASTFPFTTLIALALFKLILTPTSLGRSFAGGVIGPALVIGSALAYALARRFQPGSAYTFALPGAGAHLKPGTFTVEHLQE